MKFPRPNIIRAGASVAVVLATVVNAAVAGERAFALAEPMPVDLAWAVRGGGAQSVHSARVLLAKNAATRIHSLDRLSALPATQLAPLRAAAVAGRDAQALGLRAPAQVPAAGPVQSAAP